MNRALCQLIVHSFRGRLRRSLRLAKRPKYFLGASVGLLYVVWCCFSLYRRDWAPSERTVVDLIGASEAIASGLMLLGAVGLALFLTLGWLFSRGNGALRLNDTEVHVLMSAPLSRRSIVQYALLKGQVPLLFTAVILPVMFKPGPLGARLAMLPGYWAALTVLDWQMKSAKLWRLRTDTLPAPRARHRRLALYLTLISFWIVTLGLLAGRYEALRSAVSVTPIADGLAPWFSSIAQSLGAWRQDARLAVWLAPLTWVLSPLQPLRGVEFLRASLPVLVLIVLHHEWLARTQAPFEESVLAEERSNTTAGALNAALKRMAPRRRRRQPFRLAPRGWPEVAIVWKSLSFTFRGGVLRALAIALGALVTISVAAAWIGSPQWLMIVMLSVGVAGITMASLGAGFVQAVDLRGDLQRCDLLRTWPLTGPRLVAAYTVGIAFSSWLVGVISVGCLVSVDVSLRLSQSFGVGTDAAAANPWSHGWGAPEALVPWLGALGALPLLAAVCLMSASLNTVSVLAWPGWLAVSDATARGLSAMGQRILLGAGLMFCLLLTLLPSGLLLAGAIGIQRSYGWPFVAWELPLLGVLAAVPPAGAALMLIRLGGILWTRIDPSLEILN